MSATDYRFNRIGVLSLVGLFLAAAALFAAAPAGAKIQIESFKFETTDAGGAATQQASGHPDLSVTTFDFARANGAPLEQPRNVIVELPPGQVGAPAATPICNQAQLETAECPAESQLGMVGLAIESGGQEFELNVPLYNMSPPPGVLAQFGFLAITTSVHLVASVRSEPDYGVNITVRNTPQALPFFRVRTTFWGVPADDSHDAERWCPGGSGAKCPSNPPEILPFLTNPSACTATSIAVGRVDSWQDIDDYAEATAGNVKAGGEPIGISGCDAVDFQPKIEARPTTNVADSPSGLDLKIHLPQDRSPDGLAEAQLKDATLQLPPGMTVNPSAAAGLDGCDPAEIGLTTAVGQLPTHFNLVKPSCTDASRLGTVQLVTPLLTNPLKGNMYLAQPHLNPFGSLLALYLVVEDPATNMLIKIAGKATPDPQTGQLSVSFPRNPQLPFEDLKVNLFPGSRGALKTPLACGSYNTNSEMVPWTAPEGPTRHPTDSFDIGSSPGKAACPSSDSSAPNQPSFVAGVTDPTGGAYSPFVLTLSRADGTQPIRSLEATLPKGLLGRLAGIPYCSDRDLAAAAAKSGAAEQAAASCPAASQVGSVSIGAGAGSTPFYVSGKAYLAGPYKGAPLSLAVVTPAVAGPFDLGTVVVRNALAVDPVTTQIHVVSDPIPTILQGIPLDIRSIAVNLDRPKFTINPTNCAATSIAGSALSVFGQSAGLASRFQVGGCNALRFKPALALDLKGGTDRADYPALTATLKTRPGDANIAKAVVRLPHSAFLAQNHIGTVCTRVQFAADSCPKRSIYGKAKAVSPLLEKPLAGPVYLRSSNHELPDLVADLNGQIRVTLIGRIDSVHGGIRNSFELVPDAPVSKFVLRMKGGKKGLLTNSRNLCRAASRATAEFDAQNGRVRDLKPTVTNDCGGSKGKKSRGAKK